MGRQPCASNSKAFDEEYDPGCNQFDFIKPSSDAKPKTQY